jgi:transposase
VVSDFYYAYNVLLCRHQRCWAHFVRDLKDLREENPNGQDVVDWVDSVLGVFRRAKRYAGKRADARLEKKVAFEDKLLEIAKPYIKTDRPQHVLAKRIERFLPELFVFVEDPRVPSSNNAAERAVRPSVIARKVSGGTRSAKGSTTAMILMSLFGTWRLRGVNTLEACRQLLVTAQTAA